MAKAKEFTEEQHERLAQIEEMVAKLRDTVDFWRQTGIPEQTLLILLKHSTGYPQYQIRDILEATENLYDRYFKDENVD